MSAAYRRFLSSAGLLVLGFVLGRYSLLMWVDRPSHQATPNIQSLPPPQLSTTNSSPILPQNESPSTRTPPSPGFLSTGETGQDGGLVFTLESWGESEFVPQRGGDQIRAKDGAKFVWAKISFQNQSMASVDIHCNFHLGSALYDREGRKFDHMRGLYRIDGNTGCNDNIQPGFGSRETIVFEMPAQFKPDYVMFWDPQERIGQDRDSFGERSAIRFRLQ